MRAEDPTIAAALRAQGYTTGQFGKNHLGDKDEFLSTMHGFDEFFGNQYQERMKTVDEEILLEALRFMSDAKADDTPFFVWFNTTHMHLRTHIKDGSRARGDAGSRSTTT